MADLSARIKNEASRIGFDLAGIATAGLSPRAAAFSDWLAAGHHGDMAWLAKEPERRTDTARVVDGARSVIVVGLNYFTGDPPDDLWNDPARGRVARYAWGTDYHDVMLPMLMELGRFIEKESGRPIRWRAYVDTGPVLERDVAARAGLGFIGKNTLLIHPRAGSFLFLGEIVVDLELEPDLVPDSGGKMPEPGTCGTCRRCQDICPTHAFPVPYVLNSTRCISYLTIELKTEIPEPLRPLMRNWIYGCDECQTICPWVRQFSVASRQRFLRYDPEVAAPRLEELIQLDDEGFRARFKGSPVKRTKRRGLLRNVAVAIGNSGNPDFIPLLERATRDPEPLIRVHAAWAIGRLREADVE